MKFQKFRRGRDVHGAMRGKGRSQFARIDKACGQEEAHSSEWAARLFGQPKQKEF
jgi:hypothetical protein